MPEFEHDFNRFPELTNSQMTTLYFLSPHKQITEDFEAKVTKVIDGDTIRVKTDFRDFDFPIRLSEVSSPEKKEVGGQEAQKWLEDKIMGETVTVLVDYDNRVEKWGRLLGNILFDGMIVNEELVHNGHAVFWNNRAANDFGLNFMEELDAVASSL